MAGDGRARTRSTMLQRAALIAGGLILLALILLLTGHWILAIIFAIPAAVMAWVFFQARSVR